MGGIRTQKENNKQKELNQTVWEDFSNFNKIFTKNFNGTYRRFLLPKDGFKYTQNKFVFKIDQKDKAEIICMISTDS